MGHPAINQTALDQEALYHTDMTVGDILRRTREHYGQSLLDIERALRIKSLQIEAIEQDSVENLPGRVYAIGFVRSYSEYLGLDGDKMVKLFKTQSGRRTIKPQLDFPVGASESKIPPLWVVALSLILSIFMLIGWWSSQSHDRRLVTEIPPVPSELQVQLSNLSDNVEGLTIAADSDPMSETSAGLEEAPIVEPEAPKGILLNMIENSWVEIKDDAGKAIVSRVLKAGDQYFVPGRSDLTMSLGNAGGVQIQVDGQLLDFLGAGGQVRRNISLDPESLKSQYSLPENPKTIENLVE